MYMTTLPSDNDVCFRNKRGNNKNQTIVGRKSYEGTKKNSWQNKNKIRCQQITGN